MGSRTLTCFQTGPADPLQPGYSRMFDVSVEALLSRDGDDKDDDGMDLVS